MQQDFVVLPIFLCVELSSSVIDLLFFPLTIDVLGQNYVLKGMVRCISRHFTVAIKYDSLWVYIDDMCSSVRNYSYCQDLWQSHPKGWFFAIFEKSLISINNDIQAHLRTSETSQQNSVGTSQVNLSTADTCSTKPLTASEFSAVAFYAICFSVLKPCSYWNSDTLDAIVQFGNTFFIKTIKSQWSWALPENINILGANVNVSFVSSSNGTLVTTSSSSKLCLERFILQNQSANTGFLLYVSKLCYSCVFHKTSSEMQEN